MSDGHAVTVTVGPLVMFVIYDHPKDFPDNFVVRRWLVTGKEQVAALRPHAVVATLEEARASLPAGMNGIGRRSDDDPVIAEVWL